jgi:hypothetical protein
MTSEPRSQIRRTGTYTRLPARSKVAWARSAMLELFLPLRYRAAEAPDRSGPHRGQRPRGRRRLQAFEAAITADYDVQSAVERELVLRLANILWRLRRALIMETGLFEIQAEHYP